MIDKIKALLEKGDSWYTEQKFEEAIEAYTKAIDLNPGETEGYKKRIDAYNELYRII